MDPLLKTPLSPLLGDARLRMYQKGQIIIYQGDIPTNIFALKSGEVKMYDVDEQGNEKILHILRPPAIVPFACYTGKKAEIMWFYAALTDVEVYAFTLADLKLHMESDKELDLYLLDTIVRETHELFVRLNSMSKTTTRSKLVAALKFLGVHHSEARKNGWRRVTFTINHQLLADMAGITRESTAVAMKQFQEEHITRSPRIGILEINFEKLIAHV